MNTQLQKAIASHRPTGFTLIELLISMTLFVVLMSVAAGGFASALRTQRSIAALVDANNNASLALEQMAREMRTGIGFDKKSDTELQFVNARGEEITYRLRQDGDGSWIERLRGTFSAPELIVQKITADTVSISALRFTLMSPGGKKVPPRITINFAVASRNPALKNIVTNVQTTVSGRNF